MRKILTLCTGNLCRSPMAEYLLQQALERRGIDTVLVESAGVMAYDGSPAASRSITEMKNRGIDISRHRTRRVTPAMIDEAELVLVMEVGHVRATLAQAPQAAEKVVLLGSLIPGAEDTEIGDPYNGPPEWFTATCDRIDEAVNHLADRLKNESRETGP